MTHLSKTRVRKEVLFVELPSVLEGIEATFVETERINMHVHFNKNRDATPIMFIHGNLSGPTFFEEVMVDLSDQFFCFAPDLRGYGQTEDKVVDATRGMCDWSDDLSSLLDTMNIEKLHIVGWSMGGGAAMQFLLDHPDKVLSLTLICPVSPYGFGGTKTENGIPCYEDYAGSGGGTVNPDFIQRIKEHDTTEKDQASPLFIMNNFYFKPPFRAKREKDLLLSLLLIKTGEKAYPGDFVPSPNWPFTAPGKFGPLNAMSPKYFNASSIVDLPVKPPILWIRGSHDTVVADESFFNIATLGKLGLVPGYPGVEVCPPQPMLKQTRKVLEDYKSNGGKYYEVVVKDVAHSPHIEKPGEFVATLRNFISDNM